MADSTATNDWYSLPSHLDGDGRRLNQQHEVFQLVLSKLITTTIPKDFSGSVLDIGTGTGIWAAEFAVAYPKSRVLAIDLYAPSITPTPSNCTFRVMDVESDAEWDFPDETFDLIHTRMVLLILHEPQKLIARCFGALKAGGLVEFQEKEDPYRSEDPDPAQAAQDTLFLRHAKLRTQAAKICGVDRAVISEVPGWMGKIGFGDVRVTEHKMPIGPWMESKHLKVAGEKFKECLQWGTLGLCKRVFMDGLGWSEEEVFDHVKVVVDDLGNGKIYMQVLVIVGTKL